MKREAGEGRVKFPGKRRGRYYGDDVRRIKLEEWCKSGENVFFKGFIYMLYGRVSNGIIVVCFMMRKFSKEGRNSRSTKRNF